MTRTSESSYAPAYDLFKLMVAVILTIVLFALLMRNSQKQTPPVLSTATLTAETETATSLPVIAGIPSATLSLLPTLLPTILPTATLPILPSATSTMLPTSTLPASTSDSNACPSSPSRIQVGDRVNVLLRLNFRTGPGLNWPIIKTNNPGTNLQVIGGPICTVKDSASGLRAYLWWNVRTQDGLEGWSAEAPLISPYYFLEPVR
jgi:uncharacterized protein YraI